MKRRFLGIDPGWENNGWSDLRRGGSKVVCRRPYTDEKVWKGAHQLAKEFKTTHPDLEWIGIEYQHTRRDFAILQQSLYGAFSAEFPHAQVKLIAPTTLRSKFKIKQREGKNGLRRVAEEEGLENALLVTQHEVDAFCQAKFLQRFVCPSESD